MFRTCLLALSFTIAGLFVLAQQPGAGPEGVPTTTYKQRLNTIVRKGEQPASSYSTEDAPPADPLSFYRRNPELMKRYFPHLAPEAANPLGMPGKNADCQLAVSLMGYPPGHIAMKPGRF